MNSELKYKTYGLQVVVFLSFLALFSFIIAGIVFYGYQSNLETMLKSSDNLFEQISETIEKQIDNYLSPADKNCIIIKKLLEDNVISSSTVDFNESFFIEILKTYPQFQSIYFLDKDHNYFMTFRNDSGGYSTKIIPKSKPSEGKIIIRDKKEISEHGLEDKDLRYIPEEREWYKAITSGKASWTDVYHFHTTGEDGLTCSHPLLILDEQNNNFVVGAISIDYSLIEINSFLKNLKHLGNGKAFLVNGDGKIFAHPLKAINRKAYSGKYGKKHLPKSPFESALENGPERIAINYFFENKNRLKFNFNCNNERYIAQFKPLPEKYGNNFNIGIIVPEDELIGEIARIHETTLLFSFWLLIIAGFLTATLAKELTEPIHKTIEEADKIQNLDFDGEIDLQSPITEIQNMSDTMNSMKKALSAFKKYVPIEIVRELVQDKNDAKLEAQSNKITILFTDIRDFSAIAEETEPHALVAQLSEYFDCIATIIHKHNGTIDKYIGDSVMAFWGAPQPNKNQAKDACMAALEIEKSIEKLNSKWLSEGKKVFITRIGINTGISLIGNIGSSERFNFTAVGDSVNVANRLEGLNKVYGSNIIVSESTEKEAGKELIFRVLDMVAVKGRQQSITIYQLLGKVKDYRSRILIRLAEMSERALVHYLSSEWKEAEEKYQIILEHYPEDKTAKMFVSRCKALRENPPDSNWDGVYRLTQK